MVGLLESVHCMYQTVTFRPQSPPFPILPGPASSREIVL
jgi:hypothetical protein